jgi:hypothetical protein
VRSWNVNRHFKIERQVIAGTHQPSAQRQSIIFFTVFKAASSFIGGFLSKIALEAGLTPVNLDGYFFEKGMGNEWEGGGRVLIPVEYSATGYYYGPFRSFNRNIPDIHRYKIVLVLRDPRDVAVSGYYSMYSHAIPSGAGKKEAESIRTRRQVRLTQNVDEFVLEKVRSGPRFLARYREYRDTLIGKPNVLFLKYEDMIENFEAWLDCLLEFLDIDVGKQLLEEIKAGAGFKVSRENKYNHKRQVTPGDYKRKLAPESIEQLNVEVGDLLKSLDYPIS